MRPPEQSIDDTISLEMNQGLFANTVVMYLEVIDGCEIQILRALLHVLDHTWAVVHAVHVGETYTI